MLKQLPLIAVILLALAACNKNDDSAYPELIKNGDFETPLVFSADGWEPLSEYANYQRIPAPCSGAGQFVLNINRGNGTARFQGLRYNAVLTEQGPYNLRLNMRYRYTSDSSTVSIGIRQKSRMGDTFLVGSYIMASPLDTCLDFSAVFTNTWLDGDTARVEIWGNEVIIDNLSLRRED